MAKKIIVKIIRAYQLIVSPHLPQACRFYPTCSQYCLEAVKENGAIKGLSMGFWRILRCNPFIKNY